MKRLAALTLAMLLAVPLSAGEPDDMPAVDRAVNKALVYLAMAQENDGSWQAGNRRSAGITGLAVMAFLSAGHTPTEGPFAEHIERGVRRVMKWQQPNGVIASDGQYEMYHHGICTLMLAEVSGMVPGDLAEEVRMRLAKAVALILKSQRTMGMHAGGWRYQAARFDSDLSVTGWQLLALRAAKNTGCDVPGAALDRALDYVKRCYDGTRGAFAYMPQGQLTVACCGTGILGLELCGGPKAHRMNESLRAANYILRSPPRLESQHCYYGLYYCSQAMFQLGDENWKKYRDQVHRLLLTNQINSGAWPGRDGEGRMMGPNYTTAMGVLALTVEYRYLPIYQRGEDSDDDK